MEQMKTGSTFQAENSTNYNQVLSIKGQRGINAKTAGKSFRNILAY